MQTDYAPRLVAIARARRRRHLAFTLGLLMLPALSFYSAGGAADTPRTPVHLAQISP